MYGTLTFSSGLFIFPDFECWYCSRAGQFEMLGKTIYTQVVENECVLALSLWRGSACSQSVEAAYG
eukprot:6201629-Pleurochrysis_carterae.AAC.1